MRHGTNTPALSFSARLPWAAEIWGHGTSPRLASTDVPDLDWPEDLFSRDGAAIDEFETRQ